MVDLLVSLVPIALGVVLSPLAIMALVAVLVSSHPRSNGLAFFAGWAAAVAIGLSLSYAILGVLEVHQRSSPPLWVPIARLALGVLLLAAAVWIYRRGRVHAAAMAHATTPRDVAAAAPQLPGWLQQVATFTPRRCFFLGLGTFLLNPVNLTCSILAALDIRVSDLTPVASTVALVLFGVVAVAPIGTPVAFVLVRGRQASSALERIRQWIASHTSALNAALVLVIAVLQLQKAVSTLLNY